MDRSITTRGSVRINLLPSEIDARNLVYSEMLKDESVNIPLRVIFQRVKKQIEILPLGVKIINIDKLSI